MQNITLLLATTLLGSTSLAFAQLDTVGTESVQSVGTVTNRTSAPDAKATTTSAVSIMVRDGKAYLVRASQITPITADMSMSVSPDGTITGFQGESITLPEGQMLTMDGRFTAIPSHLSEAPTVMVDPTKQQAKDQAKAAANAEMAQANSEGTNKSKATGSKDSGLMEKNPKIRDAAKAEMNATSMGMDSTATGGNSNSSGGSSSSSGTGSGTK